MKVPTSTARKVSALVRPLEFTAVPETVTAPGYDLPLLALTHQTTRQMSVAVRIDVAVDREPRWKESHAFTVRDLIEYANHVKRPAHVVLCSSLKEGTPARVLDAEAVLREIISGITAIKSATADNAEQQRWADESRDLLSYRPRIRSPSHTTKETTMVQLMSLDQLLKATAAVGIHLEEVDDLDSGNLYVITDPAGINLYIGKAASKRRHLDEDRWKELDYERNIVSGFPVLVVENDGVRRPLSYDPKKFDGKALGDHIATHGWSGGSIDTVKDRLRNEVPPTVEDVEEVLVRTHIRTGRLIGNSQYAPQWENPIGRYSDTVAALVADAARVHGIIPQRSKEGPELGDEDADRPEDTEEHQTDEEDGPSDQS